MIMSSVEALASIVVGLIGLLMAWLEVGMRERMNALEALVETMDGRVEALEKQPRVRRK